MKSRENPNLNPPGAFIPHQDVTLSLGARTPNHHRAPSLQQLDASSSSLGKKRKSSVAERLKSIGKDISKLGRKGGKVLYDRHATTPPWGEAGPSRLSVETPVRPSETGFEEENDAFISNSDSSTAFSTPTETGPSQLPSILSTGNVHSYSLTVTEDQDTEPPAPSTVEEPASLAQMIRGLIDALPITNLSPSRFAPFSVPPTDAKELNDRPIPPPDATPIKDSRLIAVLSSATIMNGPSGIRTSVWGFLESLGAPKNQMRSEEGQVGTDVQRDSGPVPEYDNSHDAASIVFSDTSSVMVYSPLQPTKEDLVELAESVPLEPEDGGQESQQAEQESGWGRMWPFSAWYSQVEDKGKRKEVEPPPEPEVQPVPLTGPEVPRLSVDSARSEVARKRARSTQAWVPSRTKLSVQAMWWGYRLYLPPPVMDVLSDKQLEATKRTAMITTALTWFFSNLPVNSLPAAVRPALLLLQQLAPFLGYIGAFISWSWSTIKSYDLGYGVILTATWLLPVALIPGTWFEADFPLSPSLGSPTPLPPESLSAGPSFRAMQRGAVNWNPADARSYSSPLAAAPLYPIFSPSTSHPTSAPTPDTIPSTAIPSSPAAATRHVPAASPTYPMAMFPTPSSPRSPQIALPTLSCSQYIPSGSDTPSSPRATTFAHSPRNPTNSYNAEPPSAQASPHHSQPTLESPTTPRSPRISRLPSLFSSSRTPPDARFTPSSPPAISQAVPASPIQSTSSPATYPTEVLQSPRLYPLPPSPYPSSPKPLSSRHKPNPIPPVPPPNPVPLPIPPAVTPGSPQSYMLLQSPLVQTVPLPEEHVEVVVEKKHKKSKGKARALFRRSSRSA